MSLYYTYIITNQNHTVYYTGFTDDVARRTYEHMHKLLDGFTKKYNCNKLIYFEEFSSMEEAKHREKQIKRYKRAWKENLINEMNPNWNNLYEEFMI